MEIQLFQHHPVIGYTFIPNLKTRIEHESGGYLVRTNAAAFRSEHEFSNPKTNGKCRVLLFGDSFTAGDAVSNKHRFGDVLETLIPDIEVYNFGLSGTGTDQHYLVWHEIANKFEYDVVVIVAQVDARDLPRWNGNQPVACLLLEHERISGVRHHDADRFVDMWRGRHVMIYLSWLMMASAS